MRTRSYQRRKALGGLPRCRDRDCAWSTRAAAFTRFDLGGDHPGGSLGRGTVPGPRRGPDHDAEPAAADIQPSAPTSTPVSSALHSCHRFSGCTMPATTTTAGTCSHEPPRGNQDLGRCQDAHHISMGTPGARAPEKIDYRRRTLAPPARSGFWHVTSGRSRMKIHSTLSAAEACVLRKN